MDDFEPRTAGDIEQSRSRDAARRRAAAARRVESLESRPDRIAMWAFLMAIAITVAAAASSQAASSGGVDTDPAGVPDRKSMEKEIATWYGPGLWGNETACGRTLERKTVGVAHKHLPCGTEVTFLYKGNYLTTKVIDRGPFANDATWDLTQAAAKKLEFTETDDIRFSVVEPTE